MIDEELFSTIDEIKVEFYDAEGKITDTIIYKDCEYIDYGLITHFRDGNALELAIAYRAGSTKFL